jgi:hypothetical protein
MNRTSNFGDGCKRPRLTEAPLESADLHRILAPVLRGPSSGR